MPDLEELRKQLMELPARQYSNLIREVDSERREVATRTGATDSPRPGMTAEEFAHWIGRRHFEIDRGISRILYLPTGSPASEVRLLEVNSLLSWPTNEPIAAVDFMPDIEGIEYTLLVADATPAQFDAAIRDPGLLPAGWSLEGAREILPDEQ